MKKFFLIGLLTAGLLGAFAQPPQRSQIRPRVKSISSDVDRGRQQRSRRVVANDDASAIGVPFTHTLGKNTEVTDYLVVDANNDTRTWKPGGFTAYSVCMPPNDESINAADDWMISPAIHLEAGQYYTVSYEEGMSLNKTEDKLGLYAGTVRSAEGMTIPVIAEHAYPCNEKIFTLKSTQFSVAETGNYYFGFHCTSDRVNSGTPKICNFSITVCENPIVVPDNAVEVPFTHTLGKNTEVANYTVIDADEDGKSWKPGGFTGYSVCMKPTEANISANNDWMISLPVHLMPGVNYKLKYEEAFTLASGTEDRLGIYCGTSPEVAAMTIQVAAPHAITTRDFVENSADFTVANEGYYYFGFHCTSEKALSGNLKLCNFSIIESGDEIVPPAAGTLEITPAPLGELKAFVKYTAPTLDTAGNPLTSISKVVVTTNWAFKTEFTDVVPGGEYTFETTDVYNNGYNRFEAIAYIGDVAGEATLITDKFFGNDNPQPLTNVRAVLSDDFKTVTLTWDPATEVGERGGYVDTSNVTYYVFDAFGSYYDPAIATTTGTSYVFDYSNVTEQDFMAYEVTAGIDEYYYSLATASNIVTIGPPSILPFYESFADGNYAQMWVVDPDSRGQVLNGIVYDNELQTNADADEGVEPEYLNSHDADNGFFYFMPLDINSSYGFYSTKISLAGIEHPVFEFMYQGKGSVLDAKLGVNGDDLQTIRSINMQANPTDDWTLARIDLTPYKSANYIQIGVKLRAIHNTDEYIWSVPFDNLRIIDLKNENLRVSAAKVPTSVKAGENMPVAVTVENIGLNALPQAQIALTVDGVELDPIPVADFTPGKVTTATASVPTSLLSDDLIAISAEAMTDANNVVANVSRNVRVDFPKFPMPANVAGEESNNAVELSWDAPEYLHLTQPRVINEDFENPDYEPFTYSDFGGFTFVDLDGLDNYTFLQDVNNPYRSEPMAYQLFNPVLAGVPQSYLPDCPTHSGDNMLVAWSGDAMNANLLISPELTGAAQTISFWGRGFTIAGGMHESFSVWYSTTDKEISSFTEIHNVTNYPESDIVPEDWTEYSADLPEGAKYFAILHTGYDSYALFLDDFTFEMAGVLPVDTQLTGYKLYCNGEELSNTAETCATHTPEENGTYAYRLSALYNNGESRATQPVEVEINTIVGLNTAEIAPGTIVECRDRMIRVSAPEGTPVRIVDLAGRILAAGTTTIEAYIPDNGIVVVVAGNYATKVNVR